MSSLYSNGTFNRLLILSAALLTSVSSAYAENQGDSSNAEQEFSFVSGIGVATAPRYLGSDRYKSSPIPMLEASWNTAWGRFSLGGLSGLQWSISPAEGSELGLGFGAGESRKEKDDRQNLRGLGDIKGKSEITMFAAQKFGQFSLKASVAKGISSENKRSLLSLEGGYEMPLAEDLSLALGLGVTWANKAYMQQFFGVDTTQAANSGLRTYNAGAGIRDFTTSAGLHWQIDKNWTALAQVGITRLAGDARNSPIVKKATQSQVVAGVAYTW